MFRAHRAHHQERQIVSVQPLVAVTLVSVTVSCASRKWNEFTSDLHTTRPPTQSDSYQSLYWHNIVSPDDEHAVLETCRELKNK